MNRYIEEPSIFAIIFYDSFATNARGKVSVVLLDGFFRFEFAGMKYRYVMTQNILYRKICAVLVSRVAHDT